MLVCVCVCLSLSLSIHVYGKSKQGNKVPLLVYSFLFISFFRKLCLMEKIYI